MKINKFLQKNKNKVQLSLRKFLLSSRLALLIYCHYLIFFFLFENLTDSLWNFIRNFQIDVVCACVCVCAYEYMLSASTLLHFVFKEDFLFERSVHSREIFKVVGGRRRLYSGTVDWFNFFFHFIFFSPPFASKK